MINSIGIKRYDKSKGIFESTNDVHCRKREKPPPEQEVGFSNQKAIL